MLLNTSGTFSGLGATLNVAKPPKGSTVAIFGLGAVGLAVSLFSFVNLSSQLSNSLLAKAFLVYNKLMFMFMLIRLRKGLGLQGLLGLLVLM